ncbi:MAG: hypothetical protein ACREBJ_08935 [Nitrosotalea sp.]
MPSENLRLFLSIKLQRKLGRYLKKFIYSSQFTHIKSALFFELLGTNYFFMCCEDYILDPQKSGAQLIGEFSRTWIEREFTNFELINLLHFLDKLRDEYARDKTSTSTKNKKAC